MSDFLLDLRPQGRRTLSRAAERMAFAEGTQAFVIDRPAFGLVVTHTGDPGLWGPYGGPAESLVAVAGRPVFDEAEWNLSEECAGEGGLAAKTIWRLYSNQGIGALEQINGNCVVLVWDEATQNLRLVTDRAGVFPAFGVETAEGRLYGSHPDVLADAANEQHRMDEVSQAEFILSGTVSPPFTYYERIRAVDVGAILTFRMTAGGLERPTSRRYFDLTYRGDTRVSEQQLAGELAAAVQRAVRRRTLARLGPTAVALSGGLDSRVVLASSSGRDRILAFCCYDTPNRELRIAEATARKLSVRLLPLRRSADYYADHAESGVRISGGMGTFANNHFGGVIGRLKAEGTANVLTGCYSDYLFKALPLNRRVHWLTRSETLGRFRHEFYFDHFPAQTRLAELVLERWERRIPLELRDRDEPEAVFQVEVRRTFPLCYEGDNQQRLVPQRAIGWCPPFVDRDVLEVYRRIPYQYKWNRSLFRRVVACLASELKGVADANTGASPDAPPFIEWASSTRLRTERTWRRLAGVARSDESWPNWSHYVRRSEKLHHLWERPNPEAIDLFRRVLGFSGVPDNVEALKRNRPFLFVSLLSLKLWLDPRYASR